MEILLCTKALRADIYSQFVSALRTTAGCVKRRSRRAGPMCPAAKYALLPAGHAGPALQGAAVAWGGQGRSPLHVLCGTWGTPSPTHLVIASQSAPRSKCPWGTDWRGNPFSPQRKGRIPTPVTRSLARNDSAATLQGPLDKPGRMDIIVDVRGRCDKRSAPLSENFNEPYGSQKPSPCRVAVFVFQLHNTNRNGIPPDVESKYPVHVCHPLSGL